MSVGELKAHFGRTLLSCLSLVIGIISVIGIQVIGSVAQQSLIRSEELVSGRDQSAVATFPATNANRAMARDLERNLRGQALVTIEDTGARAVLAADDQAQVVGYLGALLVVYPYVTDSTLVTDQILVNDAARGSSRMPLTVSVLAPMDAVRRTTSSAFVIHGGTADAAAFVPEMILGPTSSSSVLSIHYVDPSGDGGLARQRLETSLGLVGLPTEKVETVDVLSRIRGFLDTARAAFSIAAGVTLGVGVLGILNIGLVSLRARVDELALRRALGASNQHVRVLILLESMTIGLIGSVVALAISFVAFPYAVELVVPTNPPPFPIRAALTGVLAGTAAGLLGGLVPALRAGQISIASVMRA